jgi:hypothetical protein
MFVQFIIPNFAITGQRDIPLLCRDNVPAIGKLLSVNDSFHNISYQGKVLKTKK